MHAWEAVKAMKEGKRVRRKSWPLIGMFFWFNKGLLLVGEGRQESEAKILLEDIEATDWEVLES